MGYFTEVPALTAIPGGAFALVTWLVDGSGEVSSYVGSAPGFSVAAVPSATGRWTITLPRGCDDVYLLGGSVGQADATALLHVTESQTEYTSGAATYEVRTKVNAGTLTDPASGDRVTVVLWCNHKGTVSR